MGVSASSDKTRKIIFKSSDVHTQIFVALFIVIGSNISFWLKNADNDKFLINIKYWLVLHAKHLNKTLSIRNNSINKINLNIFFIFFKIIIFGNIVQYFVCQTNIVL